MININIEDKRNIEKPSDELKEALQEVEDIENGKIKIEGYHNVNEFIEDMLN